MSALTFVNINMDNDSKLLTEAYTSKIAKADQMPPFEEVIKAFMKIYKDDPFMVSVGKNGSVRFNFSYGNIDALGHHFRPDYPLTAGIGMNPDKRKALIHGRWILNYWLPQIKNYIKRHGGYKR